MIKPARLILVLLLAATFLLAACDVEKQMDTMVDNPSFAEPLFSKFMARPEYQTKAMDTILADPQMRQMLLEKIAAEPAHAQALAEQLMASATMRELIYEMMVQPAMPADTPQAP